MSSQYKFTWREFLLESPDNAYSNTRLYFDISSRTGMVWQCHLDVNDVDIVERGIDCLATCNVVWDNTKSAMPVKAESLMRFHINSFINNSIKEGIRQQYHQRSQNKKK